MIWGKMIWGKTIWGKTIWGKMIWGKTIWGRGGWLGQIQGKVLISWQGCKRAISCMSSSATCW